MVAGDDHSARPSARLELEARLNHLLTLAGRLPQGASEDYVRRCVCEVIEAENKNQSAAIKRLRTALRHMVTPILPPFALAAAALQGNDMTTTTPTNATPTSATQVPDVPFDQASWDRWIERGRVREAAMRRRIPLIALGIAATIVVGTTLWYL